MRLLLVLAVFVATNDLSNGSCCLKAIDHKGAHHNKTLQCYIFDTFVETTLGMCAMKCFADERCKSINFDSINGTCELNYRTYENCYWCLTSSETFSYYPRHNASEIGDCGDQPKYNIMKLTNKVNQIMPPQILYCNDFEGVLINNTCYFLNTTELSWVDAISSCALTTGGNMAGITEQATLNDVVAELFTLHENAIDTWFDLSNMRNKYMYSNLRLVTSDFTNLTWNETKEDYVLCGAVQLQEGVSLISMQDCNKRKPFLCQFQNESEVTDPFCRMKPESGISFLHQRHDTFYMVLGSEATNMYARDAFYLCLERGTIPLTLTSGDGDEYYDVKDVLVIGRGYTNVVLGLAKTLVKQWFQWLDNPESPFGTNSNNVPGPADNFAMFNEDGYYYETGENKEDVGIVCKVKNYCYYFC